MRIGLLGQACCAQAVGARPRQAALAAHARSRRRVLARALKVRLVIADGRLKGTANSPAQEACKLRGLSARFLTSSTIADRCSSIWNSSGYTFREKEGSTNKMNWKSFIPTQDHDMHDLPTTWTALCALVFLLG